MIVAYRAKGRAIFLFGFAKNELENIEQDELISFRRVAEYWLSADASEISKGLEDCSIQEVENA